MTTLTFAETQFPTVIASGWGTEDIGHAWTLTGFTGSVPARSSARMPLPDASATGYAQLNTPCFDCDIRARASWQNAWVSGAFGVMRLEGRIVRAANGVTGAVAGMRYIAAAYVQDGKITLYVVRRNADATTTFLNTSGVVVPNVTVGPNQAVWLRMQITGTNPTTIRVKAWKAVNGTAGLEPALWDFSITDSTAGLNNAAIDADTGVSASHTSQTGGQVWTWHEVQVAEPFDAVRPPDAPTNLRATQPDTNGAFTLTWDDTGDIHSNYLVDESRNDGQTYTTIAVLGRLDTRYAHQWVSAFRRTYRVRAGNAQGATSSVPIVVKPTTPPAATIGTPIVRAYKPYTVDVPYTIHADRIHTYYTEIQHDTNAWHREGVGRPGSVQHGTIARTHRAIFANRYGTFRWRIVTINDGGETVGAPSTTITIVPPPGRATGLRPILYPGYRVTLQWQNESGGAITHAFVERRLDNGPEAAAWAGVNGWRQFPISSATAISYGDTLPTPGRWQYRVVRSNATDTAVSDTLTIEVPSEALHLMIHDADTTIDFVNGPAGTWNIDGYTPRIPERQASLLARGVTYADVDEAINYNIHGATARTSRAVQHAAAALVERAEPHSDDPVIFSFRPHGSIQPYPLQARVVAGGAAVGNRMLYHQYATLHDNNMAFTRRGLLTVPVPIGAQANGTVLVGNVATATFPDHPILSPLNLHLFVGSPGSLPVLPPSVLLIAGRADDIQVLDVTEGAGVTGWQRITDDTARQGGVLRYTPTTTQARTSNALRIVGELANRATHYEAFAVVRVNGTHGYHLSLEASGWGRSAATTSAKIDPLASCQVIALGSFAISPVPSLTATLTAQAAGTGGSLEIERIIIIAMDSEINRALGFPNTTHVAQAFSTPDTPMYISIINNPLAPTPVAAVTSPEYSGTAALRCDGDRALVHAGSDLACAWITTAEGGAGWNLPSYVRIALDAERWDGQLLAT